MNVGLLDFARVIGPALVGVQGLWMILNPERFRREAVQDNDRKIADRLARGHDDYFEELRSLDAYAQPSPTRNVRIFGTVFLILGLIGLGTGLAPFFARN